MKSGDVVRLKIGGPMMSIRAVQNDHREGPQVICDWFVGYDYKQEQFHQDQLILLPEELLHTVKSEWERTLPR